MLGSAAASSLLSCATAAGELSRNCTSAAGRLPRPGGAGAVDGRGEEHHEAGPGIEPEAQDVVGVVDAERFDPDPAEGVRGDAEGEEPPAGEVEASFGPEEQM